MGLRRMSVTLYSPAGFGQRFTDSNQEHMGEFAVFQHKQAGLRHIDNHLPPADRLVGIGKGSKAPANATPDSKQYDESRMVDLRMTSQSRENARSVSVIFVLAVVRAWS